MHLSRWLYLCAYPDPHSRSVAVADTVAEAAAVVFMAEAAVVVFTAVEAVADSTAVVVVADFTEVEVARIAAVAAACTA
ncbi:MAG: hypothetical protein WB987_04905, partial [Candidatus Acidiferrales bacterium]